MFLPFLPYLLALAAITVLMAAVPEGAVVGAAVPAWLLGTLYVVLPLLGSLAAQVPERWLGGPRRAALRRRGLFFLAWLGMLSLAPLPAALAQLFSALGDGQSAALVALIVNFWLGDTLCVSPLRPLEREGRAERLRAFGTALRMPVPILVLVLAGLVLPVFSSDTLLRPDAASGLGVWLRLLASMGSMAVLAILVVPVLIRVCWGLRALADGAATEAIRAELAENGVPVAAVLAWPDRMFGHATAGVIGLLPRFRYLLISPTLVAALTHEELRSVTAHEAGHLRYRHLWYYVAAVITFILGMQVLGAGLFWTGLFAGAIPPAWLLLAVELVALVAFFRLGMGFLSRHFERQADGNAVRRLGPQAFEQAIVKVAAINGIPLEQHNWHHHGIGHRIAYANVANDAPGQIAQHDRTVLRIKRVLLALLVVMAGAQVAASTPEAMDWVGERYIDQRLDAAGPPSRGDLLPLQYLGSRAVQRGDNVGAERFFRAVLRITPEDPQALNNLAWVLVTAPHPETDTLREGLRLARQAADGGDQAYIWDTLAESYFRLHAYDAAIEAASKALALAERGRGRGDAPLTYYRERLADFSKFGRGA